MQQYTNVHPNKRTGRRHGFIGKPTVRFNLRVPPDVADILRKEAQRSFQTANCLARELVCEGLKRRGLR